LQVDPLVLDDKMLRI